MMFGGLLFLGLLVLLIVWATGSSRQGAGYDRGRDAASPRPSPLDIAKERYARGEISREEFEQIREDLQT